MSHDTPHSEPEGTPTQPAMTPEAQAEFIAGLLKDVEKTRVPPEEKARILAEMPSLEESERMYRELQEKGEVVSLVEILDKFEREIEAQR